MSAEDGEGIGCTPEDLCISSGSPMAPLGVRDSRFQTQPHRHTSLLAFCRAHEQNGLQPVAAQCGTWSRTLELLKDH